MAAAAGANEAGSDDPALQESGVCRGGSSDPPALCRVARRGNPIRATIAPMESWDAVETVARIRKGEVSALEVLEATIQRAEAAGALNAIVTDTFERARARAKNGALEGALAGLPTFVKDLSQVKGVRTGWGSAGAADLVSKKSDPFVKMLERTGMLVVGKSATPEFGMTATTEPLVRGATRNPWAATRTRAGRRAERARSLPLAWCRRPRQRRWRFDPHPGGVLRPGWSQTHARPARHGGFEPRPGEPRRARLSHTHRPRHHRVPPRMSGLGEIAPAPARPLHIGLYVDSPAATQVDAQVQDAVRAAGRTCQALGHHVDEIPCPFPVQVMDDFFDYWGFLAWLQINIARLVLHRGFDKSNDRAVGERAHGFVHVEPQARVRRDPPPPSLPHALRRCSRDTTCWFHRRWPRPRRPSATSPPISRYETHHDRLRTFAAFTPLHNIAGAPALSLPLGRSTTGLPLGVQFAAGRGQDALLLELAQTLEAAHPWPRMATARSLS